MIRALKADILSLTSFEFGLFSWMTAYQVGIWGYRLEMGTWVYWWMMQVRMFLGFWTAVPVNWWLIRKDVKEPYPYTAAHTGDELHNALANLGVQWTGKLPVLPNSRVQSNATAPSHRCATACGFLSAIRKKIVSTPESQTYIQQQGRYWSLQQLQTLPTCRVTPQSAVDVAITLLITQFFSCPFAVKSGGHAAFAGASNIQDGITIDLSKLRQVEVSKDRTVTKVGAGNRWLDVYSKLDVMGLSVVGGRVAHIGVGGLTLGGGVSFFSGRHGWALDGVKNYQIVLANGHIRNVNQKSNPDLYFALRGGGNNFGIVTRFDLETFPQGLMWGGTTIHPPTTNASIFRAFENFAKNASENRDAGLITAHAYAQGSYIFSNSYEYSIPTAYPPAFAEFTAIPNITDTQRITTLTNLTLELNASNPGGFREHYTTSTFKISAALQHKILDIFVSDIENIKDATNIIPALVMQPITEPMIHLFQKNGGNALGIEEGDGPLLLMNLAILWSSETDDERILAAAKRVIRRSNEVAREMGLQYRYLYQNYASLDQDVFGGYGEANRERLLDISRRVDPDGVFQNLQPGYFKLDGGNGGSEV
ncbi:MAG: hypothetical protein Q9221_008754 [Calogaya cf. arnoldii]